MVGPPQLIREFAIILVPFMAIASDDKVIDQVGLIGEKAVPFSIIENNFNAWSFYPQQTCSQPGFLYLPLNLLKMGTALSSLGFMLCQQAFMLCNDQIQLVPFLLQGLFLIHQLFHILQGGHAADFHLRILSLQRLCCKEAQ
jgi:hypothetical protein